MILDPVQMSSRRRRDRGRRRKSEVYGASERGAAGNYDVSSPPGPLLSQKNSAIPAREGSLRLEDTILDRASVYSSAAAGGLLEAKSGPDFSTRSHKKGHHRAGSYVASAKSGGITHVAAAAPAVVASSISSSIETTMLSHAGFDRHEAGAAFDKRKSAIGVITGIFTCWSRTKDVQAAHASAHAGYGRSQLQTAASTAAPPRLNSLTATALLEQAKAQQEALLETQDTTDMWEWHMEQQQAIASQEHEMIERTSAAASGDQPAPIASAGGLAPSASRTTHAGDDTCPVLKHRKPPAQYEARRAAAAGREEDGEDEEEYGAQEWVSPAWGWRRQDGVSVHKVAQMFESALVRYRWEVNGFCRVYMQQIVRAGYSLINTLMELEPRTVFLRRVHANYALEGRINAVIFRCFENDSFDESGLTHILDPSARAASRLQEFARMKSLDPAEALRMHSAAYEPAFHSFAAAKSEEVLPLLPAAALAFPSAAHRDRFMDAFLRMAKWAWMLHRLATSTTPTATILRVAKGHAIDPVFVEAVAVPPIGSCRYCPLAALPTVEFMVMPGFVLAQRQIFRCRVYQHFMCKPPPPPPLPHHLP